MAVPSVGHAATGDVADDQRREAFDHVALEREQVARTVLAVGQLDDQCGDPRRDEHETDDAGQEDHDQVGGRSAFDVHGSRLLLHGLQHLRRE
jgi:hypothetical protein